MENKILSAALKSRADYLVYREYLDPKKWSREFAIVFDYVGDYYHRDTETASVDRDTLIAIIEGSVRNEKHVATFTQLVDEAYATDSSSANLKESVLLAKREETAQALSLAIANGKDHTDILDLYNRLRAADELESKDADSTLEVYGVDDLEKLLLEDANRENVLPIYPKALMDRLDGGLQGSDHMIVIARPEAGKTALILTIACGLARAGYPGVIFNNEERISRLIVRAISNLTGLTVQEVRKDIYAAREMALEKGFGNLTFIAMSPGSPKQIDAELERRSDSRWFVVDQLRNLVVKADNKTNQLEEAAKAIRNIGKQRDLVAISVTQAGDSAENKSVLDMGDVDSSNTGIPGACDVLLGLGANAQQKMENVRVMTPIKNKITGDHDPFPTRLNPFISKYVSI